MSVSRYKTEIALGANLILDVVAGVSKAKADDGRLDASEAVSIFLTALLSAILGVAGSQAGDSERG